MLSSENLLLGGRLCKTGGNAPWDCRQTRNHVSVSGPPTGSTALMLKASASHFHHHCAAVSLLTFRLPAMSTLAKRESSMISGSVMVVEGAPECWNVDVSN